MAKPKGCRCPYKCPVHLDRVPTVREGQSVKTTVTPPGERPGAKTAKPKDPDFSGVEAAVKAATNGKGGDPPPDPAPGTKRGGSGPVSPGKSGPTTAELADVLSEILVLPAIPAKAMLHCDFCMTHFLTTGPPAAQELAAMSETNPALRRALEKFHELYAAIMVGGVLGSYLAKPMIHHLAPEPALEAIGPVLNIPPRPEQPGKVKHSHNGKSAEKPQTPAAAASQSPGTSSQPSPSA